MNLYELIKKPTEGFNGSLGVAIKHLKTGESADINGDELFPTASVFKVPVIVDLYRQVDKGVINMDEEVTLLEKDKVPGSGILKELSEGLTISIRDLTELMMILSDNTATDIIVKIVGMDNINSTLQGFGLKETRVVASCRDILFDLIGFDHLSEDEKTIDLFKEKSLGKKRGGTWALGVENNDVTTPKEMLQLMEMIYLGEAASSESCGLIIETLKRCQTGRYRIPKYLPEDEIEIAHKTGSLPGIRNDVGIVTLLDSNDGYIISCFTKGADDVYEAEEVIANVSKNVYNYFIR